MVYWASVGLIFAIAVCTILTLLTTHQEDEELAVAQGILVAIVIFASIALGMRIEGGIF